MPTVKVCNIKNEEVGEVELSDVVFGAPFNEPLIHAAVRNYMANARQGTSATKTRGDVSGAGRKLWKQKGTGRARIASLRVHGCCGLKSSSGGTYPNTSRYVPSSLMPLSNSHV